MILNLTALASRMDLMSWEAAAAAAEPVILKIVNVKSSFEYELNLSGDFEVVGALVGSDTYKIKNNTS